MYSELDTFITPPDDTVIWRYMDFTRFMSLITDSKLFFPSALLLAENDPYEGSFTKNDVEYDPFNDQGLNHFDQSVLNRYKIDTEYQRLHTKEMRKCTYINSWYINKFESSAMWKCYAENKDGIAIKSTVGRIKIEVNKQNERMFIAKIKYIDYQADAVLNTNNLFTPFFHKRKSFEHENELRVLYFDLNGLNRFYDAQFPKIFSFPIDLDKLIDTVYVAPTAPSWIQKLITSILLQRGLEKPIQQSSLQDFGLW